MNLCLLPMEYIVHIGRWSDAATLFCLKYSCKRFWFINMKDISIADVDSSNSPVSQFIGRKIALQNKKKIDLRFLSLCSPSASLIKEFHHCTLINHVVTILPDNTNIHLTCKNSYCDTPDGSSYTYKLIETTTLFKWSNMYHGKWATMVYKSGKMITCLFARFGITQTNFRDVTNIPCDTKSLTFQLGNIDAKAANMICLYSGFSLMLLENSFIMESKYNILSLRFIHIKRKIGAIMISLLDS